MVGLFIEAVANEYKINQKHKIKSKILEHKAKIQEVEAKNHKIFYQNLNKASEVALSYGKIYKKSDDAKNKALVKAKKKYQTFRDDVLFPSANKIDGCNLELSEN